MKRIQAPPLAAGEMKMQITDEMVDRAIKANVDAKLFGAGDPRDWVRAALEAALALLPHPPEGGEMEMSNLEKELLLLNIIAGMGGRTDASDSPHSWLNWFCSDEVHNRHSDTFNRCIEKGWLCSSHDTSFDTSTAWLTEAGKAILASPAHEPASRAETEKEYWQAWARKRLEIQRKHWLRAAKSALAGDMRELRNRVELAEAEPMDIVHSAAPDDREGA